MHSLQFIWSPSPKHLQAVVCRYIEAFKGFDRILGKPLPITWNPQTNLNGLTIRTLLYEGRGFFPARITFSILIESIFQTLDFFLQLIHIFRWLSAQLFLLQLFVGTFVLPIIFLHHFCCFLNLSFCLFAEVFDWDNFSRTGDHATPNLGGMWKTLF